MIKTCVVLNNQVINIGEWDYQPIELNGELKIRNPLPDGARVEQRNFEFSETTGWHEVT